MGFLTGGSKTTQNSNNQAYPYLQGALSPTVAAGTNATNALAGSLLGTTSPGSDPAFQNYQDNSGYQWQVGQGTQAITNSAAAKGLLNSGATLKAVDQFGQNAGLQNYQNYLGNLQSLAGIGLQGAGIIGQAGQQSHQTSNSQGGLFNALGSLGQGLGTLSSSPLGGFLPSDRRLKMNIEKLDEMPDGLGIYAYHYVWGGPEQVGVMADEVAQLRPWALGPEIGGYRTVCYDMLEAA
ncbi:tail fiber domain-containing protein [Sphingomonas oligoaromativorans]|uniref:tail fiber domain-containing protein n=1 Tax=Sphingomonas oligoaromativorans TaxID=575322 RepID=UPI00141E3FC5|nr:tail fiber domain-containing protein [Sphingomonas oligoaromativorans]NIJ32795.1 hypothetical protein [Sphingomonas oligoaromativorans]